MPIAKEEQKRIIKIKPLHVKADALVFPTIITQYLDTWTPNWKSESVYGRMDPFGFYGGTQRELTLGFRVISDDLQEAQHNMQLIQKLVQYQYPAYKPRGGPVATLKAPPYFNVQIMNIAQGKPGSKGNAIGLQGYFTSALSINPGFQTKDKAQYYSEDFSQLLFSDVDVVLKMMVLHTHEVGFYKSSTGDDFGRNKYNSYPYNIAGKVNPDATGNTVAVGANNAVKLAGPGGKNDPDMFERLQKEADNPRAVAKVASLGFPVKHAFDIDDKAFNPGGILSQGKMFKTLTGRYGKGKVVRDDDGTAYWETRTLTNVI